MKLSTIIISNLLLLFLSACTYQSMPEKTSGAPFGNSVDLQYADKLWAELVDSKLAGPDAIVSTPYQGVHPHGAILETITGTIRVDGTKGAVVVKRNYGGKGVSKTTVGNNPNQYLKAITVMFQRERGYDSDNQDWFWVKYAPNGKPMKNPKGMLLAGRVAKGAAKGCIACHKGAPGNDYVFNNDRIPPRR